MLLDPSTLGPLWLTLRVLLYSGALLLGAGVLLGYYLTREKRTALRTVVDFLVTLPLVFPPIATGFVLLLLLGRSGPLGRLTGAEIVFSFPGVVAASFVAGLPLMVKPVVTALQGTTRLAEAAYVLGKSEWQAFWLVQLPNVKRELAAGWFLALGRSLGEVGITLMLGGNILGKTNTLSLEIYNSVFSGEFDRAVVLSCLIGLFSLLIYFALKRLSAV
ncbi:molybdate ABC transporter permease subunit [Paucidesulfovibrio longus]|uniref:molybdate ABC transporter permease subunit n=1 Tax=Paucidesulfovibrio longus TaxID=889 RepID=UPI0003B46E9A|nr:ABC transporter permease subunit [Paucidesulfovibrio longus]